MKVFFYTLGCKVNQYESQSLSELLNKFGYETVGKDENADVLTPAPLRPNRTEKPVRPCAALKGITRTPSLF